MSVFWKTKKYIFFLAGSVLLIGVFFLIWGVFSTQGSNAVAIFFLDRYIGKGNYSIASLQGKLSSRVLVRGVEIRGMKNFPSEASIKIQTLELYTGLSGLTAKIGNGRLLLPGSDAIVINGRIRNGYFDDTDIFAPKIGVSDMLFFLPPNRFLKGLGGALEGFKCTLSGRVFSPEISGSFRIKHISRRDFSIQEASAKIGISLGRSPGKTGIKGELIIEGGKLSGPRSSVSLRRGKMDFLGDPGDIKVDFAAKADIDGYKIDISLEGPVYNPTISLRSSPHLPEEAILLLLATGKSWRSIERSINEGEVSEDIAKDFVEFFVFSGSGSALAEKVGLKEFNFSYDDGTGGFEAKKNITERTDVKYGYIQEVGTGIPVPGRGGNTSHTIGGEYRVTDTISVEGEKSASDSRSFTDPSAEARDKVMLKYKKSF